MVDAVMQRGNMVESQVRPSDVTDARILRAMLDIPREEFVPPTMRALAYMDADVPLGGLSDTSANRALLAPRIFAKLLQLADVKSGDVILDVGCATGYSSAVLTKIGETVVALESDAELSELALKNMGKLSLDNVVVLTGDMTAGYPQEGPYDAIVLGGVVEHVPVELLDQLKDGGRLVGLVCSGSMDRAVVWKRFGAHFDKTTGFEAGGFRLPGFEKPQAFVF